MDVLITGGCGFIGTNLTLDRVSRGDRVRVLDDCSRPGVERNRDFLDREYGDTVDIVEGDVRDATLVARLAAEADVIFHLAAQVAVTGSVLEPRADFEVNAAGTLNVLEGARLATRRPAVVYASTNKVYGGLEGIELTETDRAYVAATLPDGVGEAQPLDFHSPYGCSKGAADQYTTDYCRIYGVPTVVFRQSCIYGPWQYGNEDQGWIAHFLLRAVAGDAITLYGDGKQVRDVLFVDDLLDAYDASLTRIDEAAGRVFNVGGGPAHTTSLLDFVDLLSGMLGRPVDVEHGDWRPGDQRFYVSDVRRAADVLGWAPSTALELGVARLSGWIRSQVDSFRQDVA